MKSSSVALLLLLALAMASRPSLAASGHGESGGGSSIAAMVGRELRSFVAKADNIFRSAGWHTTASGGTEAKNLRAVAARRRPRKSGARCVSAAMCRKRRVICGKRCYGASRAASVNHVPRCVVKCRKCVPTC